MEWKSYIIAFIITAAAAVLTLYSCSTAKMQPQPQQKQVRTAIQENNKDQSLLHEYFSGVTTAIIEG